MSRLAPLALLLFVACDVEELGIGSGTITVRNEDAKDYAIVISDNDDCMLGMQGKMENNTTTTFDVKKPDEGGQSYFCTARNGNGVPVEDGKTYHIKGGQFAETK